MLPFANRDKKEIEVKKCSDQDCQREECVYHYGGTEYESTTYPKYEMASMVED